MHIYNHSNVIIFHQHWIQHQLWLVSFGKANALGGLQLFHKFFIFIYHFYSLFSPKWLIPLWSSSLNLFPIALFFPIPLIHLSTSQLVPHAHVPCPSSVCVHTSMPNTSCWWSASRSPSSPYHSPLLFLAARNSQDWGSKSDGPQYRSALMSCNELEAIGLRGCPALLRSYLCVVEVKYAIVT